MSVRSTAISPVAGGSCQVKSNGRIQLGGCWWYLGNRLAGQPVNVTFDPDSQHLLSKPKDKSVAVAVANQGMSREALKGEFAGVVRLPTYQMALPLSPCDYRQLHYAAALTGTDL